MVKTALPGGPKLSIKEAERGIEEREPMTIDLTTMSRGKPKNISVILQNHVNRDITPSYVFKLLVERVIARQFIPDSELRTTAPYSDLVFFDVFYDKEMIVFRRKK